MHNIQITDKQQMNTSYISDSMEPERGNNKTSITFKIIVGTHIDFVNFSSETKNEYSNIMQEILTNNQFKIL